MSHEEYPEKLEDFLKRINPERTLWAKEELAVEKKDEFPKRMQAYVTLSAIDYDIISVGDYTTSIAKRIICGQFLLDAQFNAEKEFEEALEKKKLEFYNEIKAIHPKIEIVKGIIVFAKPTKE